VFLYRLRLGFVTSSWTTFSVGHLCFASSTASALMSVIMISTCGRRLLSSTATLQNLPTLCFLNAHKMIIRLPP